MKKISRIIPILAFISICIIFTSVEGGTFTTLSDCLITNDIGIYGYKAQRANIGKGSGVVGLAGHFDKDHIDTVCTGRYSNINQIRGLPHEELRQKLISVKVQVTQHAGSDSDRWLLHEVERGFRNYYGIPGRAFSYRIIDGQSVLEDAAGGRNYRWISDNKVIVIEYHDSQMTKAEPLEVVRSYLSKHPSTLTYMSLKDLRSTDNKTKWIKDEMGRRLWLGDKWFMALQLGKAEQKAVLQHTVDSMKVFLDYREKYYGVSAKSEKQLLWKYMIENNGTAIKNKLEEYKSWWEANKDKPINL